MDPGSVIENEDSENRCEHGLMTLFHLIKHALLMLDRGHHPSSRRKYEFLVVELMCERRLLKYKTIIVTDPVSPLFLYLAAHRYEVLGKSIFVVVIFFWGLRACQYIDEID